MATGTVVSFPIGARPAHECHGPVETLLLLRQAKAELAELKNSSCERRSLLEATVHLVRRYPIAERSRIISELGLRTETYQAMVHELSELTARITRLEWEVARLDAVYYENRRRKTPVS